MTVVEQPRKGGLLARVQGILMRPKAEWEVIDAEPATVQSLYLGYACILAAIPAIAGFIGGQLFGVGAFGVSWHPPIISGLVQAILTYVLSLAAVFVVALIIDGLAPNFGGQKNQVQALKVAVYSYTAGWVAGIVEIVPMLSILAVLGAIYGLYILYQGLPRLMKSAPEKTTGYFVVTLIVAIVVNIVIAGVVGAITSRALMGGPSVTTVTSNGRTISVNGSKVDVGRLQASAAAAAAAAEAMQKGQTANGKAVAAVDPERLKALLPATVAGLPRTDLSAQSAGAAGMSSSTAEATYSKDAARITVTVTDLAAAGAFAGMANAMNLQSSKQTATGYEKVGRVDGRMTTEEWDNQSKSGKYGVLVANRFMVQADGSASSIDDLKAAVAAVGPDRLEGMAKA